MLVRQLVVDVLHSLHMIQSLLVDDHDLPGLVEESHESVVV